MSVFYPIYGEQAERKCGWYGKEIIGNDIGGIVAVVSYCFGKT